VGGENEKGRRAGRRCSGVDNTSPRGTNLSEACSGTHRRKKLKANARTGRRVLGGRTQVGTMASTRTRGGHAGELIGMTLVPVAGREE